MYKNIPAFRKSKAIMYIQYLLGLPGVLFWAASIMAALAGEVEIDPPYICFFIIPHIFSLHAGRKRRKVLRTADRIAGIMENDADGILKVKELAGMLEMNVVDTKSILEKIYAQKLFENTVYERQNQALYFPVSEAVRTLVPKKRTVSVQCPNCGGMNMLIAGRTGKCLYCEGPITSRAMRRR